MFKFRKDKRGNLMVDNGMILFKRIGLGLKINKILRFIKSFLVKMVRVFFVFFG